MELTGTCSACASTNCLQDRCKLSQASWACASSVYLQQVVVSSRAQLVSSVRNATHIVSSVRNATHIVRDLRIHCNRVSTIRYLDCNMSVCSRKQTIQTTISTRLQFIGSSQQTRPCTIGACTLECAGHWKAAPCGSPSGHANSVCRPCRYKHVHGPSCLWSGA